MNEKIVEGAGVVGVTSGVFAAIAARPDMSLEGVIGITVVGVMGVVAIAGRDIVRYWRRT